MKLPENYNKNDVIQILEQHYHHLMTLCNQIDENSITGQEAIENIRDEIFRIYEIVTSLDPESVPLDVKNQYKNIVIKYLTGSNGFLN